MLINIHKYWFSNPKCWFSPKNDKELKELFLEVYQNTPRDYRNLLRNLRYEIQTYNQNYNLNQIEIIKNSVLGFIILFDQIPRNIFRNTPQAYENDELISTFVLEVSKIIFNNLDILSIDEFNFFILPLIHLEDKTLEVSNIANDLTTEYWNKKENLSKFAVLKKRKMFININKHQELLKKFGRYPLRNSILNRESTISETLYISSRHKRMF